MNALHKLTAAQQRTGGLVSAGLEPHADYLPAGFAPTLRGYEDFLTLVIDATAGLVCAYKFNLAFFEALGVAGVDLLYRVRDRLPSDVLIIADAKRGDIGSTARCYASALYESLGADSATVNPLMGRDSAEPFLAYRDKLTFFLVLTSNPGAGDFILQDRLYLKLASAVNSWSVPAGGSNCGMVVGATHAPLAAEVRRLAPELPFLIPGVGAQGGDLEDTARHARRADGRADGFSGLLFHVTRGLLPARDEPGDPGDIIRRKAVEWRNRTRTAVEQAGKEPTHVTR